jgi:hypothetical protein
VYVFVYLDAACGASPCRVKSCVVAPYVVQVGYFPEERGLFVRCAPMNACLGGVNVTSAANSAVACAKNYRGRRCAECNLGSYR